MQFVLGSWKASMERDGPGEAKKMAGMEAGRVHAVCVRRLERIVGKTRSRRNRRIAGM